MPEKPAPTRKVQREHKGSKNVSTINVRGYRVAGQIFSRLLFLNRDPKTLLPPSQLPIANTPPDNIFDPLLSQSSQSEMSDYVLEPVKIEVLRVGIKKKKGLFIDDSWEVPPKKLGTEMETEGQFSFSSAWLEYDRTYKVLATLAFDKKGVRSEQVRLNFRVRKQDLRKMKKEKKKAMEIPVRVEHAVQRISSEQEKEDWYVFDKYNLKVKFFLMEEGKGNLLWLGGPKSVVFNTFVLNVPFLHQSQDAPKETELPLKMVDRTWKLPVKDEYLCAATCTTMVLRYFGLKVSIKDVLLKTALEYFKDSTHKPKWGLSNENHKNGILQLKPEEGTYPYCIERLLTKAAEALFEETKVPIRNIISTWRTFSPTHDSWIHTRTLLGAGIPVIGVKSLSAEIGMEEDEEGERISHGAVIIGAILKHTGELFAYYKNDPISEGRKSEVGQAKMHGQIIVGRMLEQNQICPTPQRLLNGGKVPAKKRMLVPEGTQLGDS
jgi:hypothetical protein